MKALLKGSIRKYLPMSSEVLVDDGLLMMGCRIVIRSGLQQEMLSELMIVIKESSRVS